MSRGLLLLHAVSGCNTVSSFSGIGKKTAFSVWKSMRHIVPVFSHLSQAPEEINEEDMKEIERFVILLYKSTSSLSDINEARKQMFCAARQIENIPPSKDALEEHLKRAVYQAGHVWGQALVPNPELPSPSEWGWQNELGTWKPLWTKLPEASKACRELIKCGCLKRCKGNCKCSKSNLSCTQLCACNGQCYRD